MYYHKFVLPFINMMDSVVARMLLGSPKVLRLIPKGTLALGTCRAPRARCAGMCLNLL